MTKTNGKCCLFFYFGTKTFFNLWVLFHILKKKNIFYLMNVNYNCSNLKVGDTGRVLGFEKSIGEKIKKRLLELGFIEGKTIKLLQWSLAGDVLLIELNGYLLSIRKNIAKYIMLRG